MLNDEEEAKLEVLEEIFLTTDKNFEGLIPYEKFMDCLRDANLQLENEMDQMYLVKFVSIFEQGVDYYGFLRQLRYIGWRENRNILDVIGLFVQEQKDIEAGVVKESTYNVSQINNKEDKMLEGRHRRFSSCASIQELDPSNPLTQLIEDLALDGADVDLALLKTAFGMIGIEPKEEDMEFIVLYLCTDESGFVDFRYFLQFVQENYETKEPGDASSFDLVKAITAVANQLRIYVREEERRKEQQQKVKDRLVKTEKLNDNVKDKEQNELEELEKEEHRLRSLRLKEKVRQYR